MSPQEMINRYVHDVARRLPWRLRGDVEAELRGLFTEELAGDTGDGAEERMKATLVNFGTPAEVALRYDASPPVIDPIDSRRFWQVAATVFFVVVLLRVSLPETTLVEPAVSAASVSAASVSAASVSGSSVNGSAATGTAASSPAASGSLASGAEKPSDWSSVLWLTVLPTLGLATLIFWAIGALRRRSTGRAFDPRRLPPVRDLDALSAANRFGYTAAVVFFVLGTLVLLQPGRALDVLSSGRVAPEAIAAFAYDPDFLAVRAPWVLANMVFGILLWAWVALVGRWTGVTRRIELVGTVFTNAVLLWTLKAGPIFSAVATDRTAKSFLALIVTGTLLDAWWTWDRLRATRAQPHVMRAA